MRKAWILIGIAFIFSALSLNLVFSSNNQPLFLLGENEKAEIIGSDKEKVSLEIGKNPLGLIEAINGTKILICGGESKKNNEIMQPASIRLLSGDLKNISKTIKLDAPLSVYEVDFQNSVLWLGTKGGTSEKSIISAKLFKVGMNDLSVTEISLDAIPCEISLSNNKKWLAIATLGQSEQPYSTLQIIDRIKFEVAACFQTFKNPSGLVFSENDTHLIMAGYGYQESFKIPREYFVKTAQPLKPGFTVIDLSSLQKNEVKLDNISQDFILGQNNALYAISTQDQKKKIVAVNTMGINWENMLDFTPSCVQERPGTNELYVIGEKRIRILNRDNGQVIKDLNAESELKNITFDSTYAYLYNLNNRKLNMIKLENLTLEKEAAVASSGRAVFKVFVVLASFVEYHNSLQPQYMGGVRIPHRVSQIYWVHTPRGNMVIGPDGKKLYLLSPTTSQITVFDLAKRKVTKKIKIDEEPQYLVLSPNKKFIIYVSGETWQVINTENEKVTCKFGDGSGSAFKLVFQESDSAKPYFSPSGDKLYVPGNSNVKVIDMNTGKKLKNIETKAKSPLVCW